MSYSKFLLILALFFSGSIQAQKISRRNADRDVAALKRIFFKEHPAPFAYIGCDSVNAILNSLTRFEGDSLSLHQWEWRVRELLIRIGCGHTYMTGNPKLIAIKDPKVLPIDVFLNAQQIWLTGIRDSAQMDAIPKGAEILRINDLTAKEIIERLRRHQPSDGYNTSMGLRTINKPLYFSYFLRKYMLRDTLLRLTWRIENDTSLHQTNVKAIAEKDMIKVKALAADTTRKILFHTKKNQQYFYFHPQHPDIGVLRSTAFRGKGTSLYKKAFKEMNRRKTPYLVIDVRDNLGGDFTSCMDIVTYISTEKLKMQGSRPLFRTWRHQPFKTVMGRIGAVLYLDVLKLRPRWIKHGKLKQRIQFRPRKRRHYKGQVFVITNGWSFSASSLMATYLKEQSSAIIVGTETGGGARTNNGLIIPQFVLPGSRIRIKVPQYNLDYHLGPDQGQGVTPHIPTNYTVQDILDKRDLEWEAVLGKIKR